MQRRKTSVWTPDTDPRARRQREEKQPSEKESPPEPPEPKPQVVQEPLPPVADKPKPEPKPKLKPEAKSDPQSKPSPDEPKEVTETKEKVEKATAKKAKAKAGSPKKSTLKARRRMIARCQRATDYFQKQVREKTEMVFIGYGETVDCTIVRGLVFEWILAVDKKRDKRKKTDFSCCYKQKESETVLATMITDSAVVSQKCVRSVLPPEGLEPIVPRKGRYKVSNDVLKTSQANKSPMTVALRTGQVFTGIVDWFTPFDIALILSNEGKVKVFRHGINDVKVDAPEVKDEE
jgi:sRNA-binding regulator protein Hfq